jgi:YVTN family beta-propeller protein
MKRVAGIILATVSLSCTPAVQLRAETPIAVLHNGGLMGVNDSARTHSTGRPATPAYRSPQAICLAPDGMKAYVVNSTADTVSILDVRARKVVGEIAVHQRPNHAAFSPDGKFLYVSCSWAGVVDVVDVTLNRVVRSFSAGLEPNGVTPSHDGKRLYVANVISDDVSIIDVTTGDTIATVPVVNQPRFATETPDGSRLIVANNLGRSLSIIDTVSGHVVETRDLDRCSMLRQIACTSDGHWAFVANLVSHDEAPTLQIERGWIHSNGFTVVDLTRPGHRVTLLLDHLLRGAANPTGLVLSADNQHLYISLAGIHEIAFVDVAACLRLVEETNTPTRVRRLQENVEILEQRHIAQRFDCGGLGPRSLALSEATGELFVANYFSDSVAVMDAATGAIRANIPLGAAQELSLWRKGELYSTDARFCYQNWYSCASCHQEDATVDGLTWDLANDGLGNPKSAKDLLNAHDTAPAMWGAVREDLNDGVAGGQRFLGFVANGEKQKALMAYFTNPEYAPNPYRGRAPATEARGQALFTTTGCTICHPAPLFTDQKVHDLGFGTADDFRTRFDTPSLRSTYRTGPWLHDGRAKTLHAIFDQHNPLDVHGRTKGLTTAEIDDLVAYLRTL